MEQSKVDLFIASSGSNFPSDKLMVVKDILTSMDDSKYVAIQAVSYKNPTVVLICALFLGALGVDRFMLGQVGLGILKLLTSWLGIWVIIDWFTAIGRTKKYNFEKFSSSAA